MAEEFEAIWDGEGVIVLRGRFDASQAVKAEKALALAEGATDIDCEALVYISSAGIGCLLAVQKRLGALNCSLRLIRMRPHIRELFELAGFDTVFEIVA